MVTFTSALAAIIDTISFFFQAEDGIRDTSVTGVQTCALPISQLATLADAKVASCAGAFVLLLQHLHPLVIAQKFESPVGRAVVHYDGLVIREMLRPQRVQSGPDISSPVVSRHDDGEQHQVSATQAVNVCRGRCNSSARSLCGRRSTMKSAGICGW